MIYDIARCMYIDTAGAKLPVMPWHRLNYECASFYRNVAQFGLEHLVWDQGVACSNRVIPTIDRGVAQLVTSACLTSKMSGVRVPPPLPLIFFGSIAQSVEQRTENPCVTGSIPVGATTFFI